MLRALACVLALSACSVGAPPGFAKGDSWTIPLIGPLEDGLLLVPALVDGKGPFVFAIDTDAHVSIIDQDVLAETGGRTGEGPRLLDENDRQQNRFYAEVLEWQLGTLTVKQKPAQLVPAKTFDVDGRRVHGVIGRDIIAESLVFGFDREAGTITLATHKVAKAPPGAVALSYSTLRSQIENVEVVPIGRRLVSATINGERFKMHLDLGATASQLRERSWAKAKLVESPLDSAVIDEVAMTRKVTKQGVAETVVAGSTSRDVTFVPYVDKRWPEQDLEGTLGLGFFKPFNVTIDWDESKYYLSQRHPIARTIAARVGRWQSKTLAACKDVGCFKVSLIDPLAGKPADQMPAKHPGLVVSFVREQAAMPLDLELLVAVTPAAGKPPLDWLLVNAPADTNRVMTHLPVDYIGATLTVVDVSPFPRKCPADGGCIDRLAAPQPFDAGETAKPGGLVPVTALKRRAGDNLITPDDEEKVAFGGGRIMGQYDACLDETGTPATVTIAKPSGLPNYDAKIVRTITNEWRYEPFVTNGKPIAVCTRITIIYNQR